MGKAASISSPVYSQGQAHPWRTPPRVQPGERRPPEATPMRKPRTLIASPLNWRTTAVPVPHPAIPVLAERGGTQLKTPRPVVLVDTREQNPFDFSRFEGWFAGIEKKPLKLGDYSIAGLEDICAVERKDLPDPNPLIDFRTHRIHQPSPAHGPVSPSMASHHGCSER